MKPLGFPHTNRVRCACCRRGMGDGKAAEKRVASREVAEQLEGVVADADIRLAELDAATHDDTQGWCEGHPLAVNDYDVPHSVPIDDWVAALDKYMGARIG